ncbi:MAG: ankyrin repeat domain-containing protein, partial [Desulfobacteraceae bacterium]|nr:ankyrin repeat domain-containing protein [Desulfobacteraceae bacterium]
MALDPAQSINSNNVYQSGQNDTDNSGKSAKMLQPLHQNPSPKAVVCNNNQNSDIAKSKKFNFGKLVRQTIIKNAYPQDEKYEHLIEAVKNGADVNKTYKGVTLLLWAAEKGHVDVVNALLSHPDMDVNQRNDWGRTPLLVAAENGHIEAVKLLLSHLKIDVNKADRWGRTALSKAVENGHIEAVKLLLSHLKIDVNKADDWGETPLLWAAE